MNIAQIENNLQHLVQSFKKDSFMYDLLLAYGQPKASITRLQKGGLNLSKTPGEIAWKKKLFFKEVNGEDLHNLIDSITKHERSIKHDPRFIIVTDYETLLAVDKKTTDTLDIQILDIAKHFDFFLPWAGMEKAQHQGENPADVKAAEKMAKLYDEIRKDNPAQTAAEVHNLNVFLSRLLFCFFAEDTGIFEKTQFTNAIASHTQPDGSDLNTYLDDLFEVMNIDKPDRVNLPAFQDAFPYVNGGLYRNRHNAPLFSRKSRQVLIECGNLQWKDIHPDIFGSMIQAVVKPEERGGFGMHYTSVPNIMKVIKPLFLDELFEEFNAAQHDPRRLQKLLERIGKIKVFDPACGSGNFLIIAYKELRLLEIKILQQLQNLQKAATGFEPKQMELIPKAQLTLAASYQQSMFSRVELSQFYGIEIDDFAHEIAILSLWLAQHQMNMKFKEVFGSANPTLPLKAGGNILQGNATRIDWDEACQKNDIDEIYLLGNPPYLGGKTQSSEQKKDMEIAFGGQKGIGELDYIACWFIKAANFITINSRFAFVSTNSICQGSQVHQLWPLIFNNNLEIAFAIKPFPWSNNAKNKAAVICSIIGVRTISQNPKYIIDVLHNKEVDNISPYLIEGNNTIIFPQLKPISKLPQILTGNSPYDGGNLLLSNEEKNNLYSADEHSIRFLRKIMGSFEYLNGDQRWCLWIEDEKLAEAKKIKFISDRIEKTREFRIKGGDVARGLVNKSHQFRYTHTAKKNLIILPRVSSERRKYIPFGFLEPEYIVSDSAQAIYDPEPYVLGIILSQMHMVWVKTIAGRLKSDFRYSSALCYNTFPFPIINESQKQSIERSVYKV
jgi:hypothetical protein